MVTVCRNNGPLLELLDAKAVLERQLDIHGLKDRKRAAKQRASFLFSSSTRTEEDCINQSSDDTDHAVPYFNHAVYVNANLVVGC